MDAKQFLKDHEAEAFKKIACAMGKEDVHAEFERVDEDSPYTDEHVVWFAGKGGQDIFDPLTNAEQWIECLMWYRGKVWGQQGSMRSCYRKVSRAVDTHEALLIAILEFIGGE